MPEHPGPLPAFGMAMAVTVMSVFAVLGVTVTRL
jgi:hypothetical protein